MATHDIPGMAVALTVAGQRHEFDFGVADPISGRLVDGATVFEVGSISKLYTGLLGAWAQTRGALSLSDPASRHLPALAGTAFDRVTLLDLATYTAGGLPLQFPDAVTDEASMLAYYRAWQPTAAPATQRRYSNPSIGLFGHLAARSLGLPFDEAMHTHLLPALGLSDTFLRVPATREKDYAWGRNQKGARVRVQPGALDAEAYGIKTTASDLLRFVEANLNGARLAAPWQRAITDTHLAHYRAGEVMQCLGWERYDAPVTLPRLLNGNSSEMALQPHAVERFDPARAETTDTFLNKTGSTGGFGAYVACEPARGVGIALLANRNYPNAARVEAAHRILQAVQTAAR